MIWIKNSFSTVCLLLKCCLVNFFSLAELFQKIWNKISHKISTRLARHHKQRFSASDAAASTQSNFCTSWIDIALSLLKQWLICIQIFGSLSSGINKKGSNYWAVSSICSRISRYINLKLTFSIVFVSVLMFIFSNFQFVLNCQKLWHLKNQIFLLLHTAWIFLAYPLSPLPLTCDTHVVFVQWNVSQYVQIWIFNISNTDSFTQTIYL